MRACTSIAIDPLQRAVSLPLGLCKGGDVLPDDAPDNCLDQVVETPSCIIECSSDLLYYIGSLAWNLTVLIQAKFDGTQWTAVTCCKNPPPAYIEGLLKEGNLVLGGSLG